MISLFRQYLKQSYKVDQEDCQLLGSFDDLQLYYKCQTLICVKCIDINCFLLVLIDNLCGIFSCFIFFFSISSLLIPEPNDEASFLPFLSSQTVIGFEMDLFVRYRFRSVDLADTAASILLVLLV